MERVNHLADLLVEKHRHGPTTKIELFFDDRFTPLKDISPIERLRPSVTSITPRRRDLCRKSGAKALTAVLRHVILRRHETIPISKQPLCQSRLAAVVDQLPHLVARLQIRASPAWSRRARYGLGNGTCGARPRQHWVRYVFCRAP